ncbi:universal stress protein [Natrinema sp. 1APR25-10V2]|uniref:universal stress protein n=1 Tax=Natrinema sp. 1APR25-10V2 TaxID=2951081 RepID=UPI002876ECF7|nr:universal stress protein [Natrinema sp. 1APR25-10V2]MDS0475301.1 universal stress protein [Natrinema sp. 1APR25-10V2]
MAQQILVAFDESPQATAALRHALSTYDDAEIHVLHVNDPREWSTADGMDGFLYSQDAFEQSQESAEALLEDAEGIAREYDAAVTTAAEVGMVAETVIDYAEEHDIDHIVLGSHGRRGLSRFLLGSVAERVMKRAPGSVTIIRDENPADDR